MSTCFQVRNWKNEHVSGINVTVRYGGTSRLVVTDVNGIARFAETVPDDAQVFSVGETTATRVPCAVETPPIPPEGGESVIGTVGQSCDILQKYMFGQAWYKHRNRYTGSGSHWDSEVNDAKRAAYDDASCKNPPPPPPKTVNDVQKDVDVLRGTISSLEGRVQDIVTSITEMGKALVDLEARIKAWVIDRITDALAPIKTLIDGATSRISTLETQMKGIQIPALPDFNAIISKAIVTALTPITTSITALKTWITDNIFELLMKKLDEGARDVRTK